MTPSQVLAPLSALLRLTAALLGRRRLIPSKNLTARVHMRGIVAELPSDIPLKIVDEFGHHHRGVYALSLLIRNQGSEEIVPGSFVENSPLTVVLDEGVSIIRAHCFANDDELICSASKLDDRTVGVNFDCINPCDFIKLVIFHGGKAMTSVRVTGRIVGQQESMDQTAEEARAAPGERVFSFLALSATVNTVTGFPLSLWLIHRDYGFDKLLDAPIPIPIYLVAPAFFGMFILIMFIWSRADAWLERRKYPDGFPLHSDFEPPVWEGIKALARSAIFGKKQRLSSSLFSRAEPVIFNSKKSRRLTVDDWVA